MSTVIDKINAVTLVACKHCPCKRVSTAPVRLVVLFALPEHPVPGEVVAVGLRVLTSPRLASCQSSILHCTYRRSRTRIPPCRASENLPELAEALSVMRLDDPPLLPSRWGAPHLGSRHRCVSDFEQNTVTDPALPFWADGQISSTSTIEFSSCIDIKHSFQHALTLAHHSIRLRHFCQVQRHQALQLSE